LNFDLRGARKASFSSVKPSSPKVASTPSRSDSKSIVVDDTRRLSHPNVDAAEHAVLEQAGLVDLEKTPDGKRPASGSEVEESKDQVAEKDKMDRGKIRRSLHRTLRDAHVVPPHRSSRKGRESASASAPESPEDVLARGTGSFVFHGKQASVITIGPELQNMSPDERLRLRKQSHKVEPGMSSPATIDDDFHSILAEPFEYHERHGSAATADTTTLKELREQGGTNSSTRTPVIVTSAAEDDHPAVNLTEEQGTCIASAKYGEEDEERDRSEDLLTAQNEFYTPQASNSPVSVAFPDNHQEREDTDDLEPVIERIPSPAMATVGA
jgi:hypothetical protein